MSLKLNFHAALRVQTRSTSDSVVSFTHTYLPYLGYRNTQEFLQILLISLYATICCSFTAIFILSWYFSEEQRIAYVVMYSVTGQRYASLLQQYVILALKAGPSLRKIVFSETAAHLPFYWWQTLLDKTLFFTAYSASYQDKNSCVFWLWETQTLCLPCSIASLPGVKDSTVYTIFAASHVTLFYTVEFDFMLQDSSRQLCAAYCYNMFCQCQTTIFYSFLFLFDSRYITFPCGIFWTLVLNKISPILYAIFKFHEILYNGVWYRTNLWTPSVLYNDYFYYILMHKHCVMCILS